MSVPNYLLYGQPSDGPVDWFLNTEILAKRCKERGWKIGLHSHPGFAQIMIVLQGSGTMKLQQMEIPFASPCALIIPIDTIHGFDYELETDGRVLTLADYCVQQTLSRLPQVSELLGQPAVIPLKKDAKQLDLLSRRIDNIERELKGKGESYEVIIESDLIAILIELQRAALQVKSSTSEFNDRQLKIVADFKALIEEHLHSNLKITRYSELLNVSGFQLRSSCECVTGKSPKEIVEERRLMEAKKDLIFTAKPIEQIAYKLGFTDPSYFTRYFKKMEGESPSIFRETFKNKGDSGQDASATIN